MTQGEEAPPGPVRCGAGWEVWFSSRPHLKERVGGDLCFAGPAGKAVLVVVADVLGHGEAAYRSAQALLAVLQLARDPDLEGVLLKLEATARRGRGCALFTALLWDEYVEYVLVGSIRSWIVGPSSKTMLVGQPGIVGAGRLQPRVRRLAVEAGATLVVCTDGIRQAFFPGPGLLPGDSAGMALVLRRIIADYGIAEDDASVLVARRRAGSG